MESFVVFDIDGSEYGIPLKRVFRILRAVAITPLAQPPPYCMGIFSMHGQIVPVFSLRELLNCPSKDLELTDQFFVLQEEENYFALCGDKVTEILSADISTNELSHAPACDKLEGVIKREGKLILIYDWAKLIEYKPNAMAMDKS
jgi:purine-binding chemotaxis protein CheW